MRIDIFEFMDVQCFLQDFYRDRKKKDPGFSYTRWSQELGFSNKTLLRLILQGKRQISSSSRERFKKSLNLCGLESDYFEALIDYKQSKTASQRTAASARLLQLQRQNFVPATIPADDGILHDVFGPVVLMAISSSSSLMTSQEIAETFSLDQERVDRLLKNLLEKSLIEKKEEGFRSLQNTFRIADHFGNQGLRDFYVYWLQQSVQAINLPFEERRFRSLQIALSKDEFEEMTKLFSDFAVSILSRVEKNTLDCRRLYMMNTAFFPITTSFGS